MKKLLLFWGLIICGLRLQGATLSFSETDRVFQVIDSLNSSGFSAISRDYWGSISFSKGDYQGAMVLFRAAATDYNKLQYPVAYANALRNIGRTYLMLSRPDSAICYYLQAQEAVATYDALTFMDIAGELSEICRCVDDWKDAQQRMLLYRKQQAMDESCRRRFSNGMFVMEKDFIRNKKEALANLGGNDSKRKNYTQFALYYQELYSNWCNLNKDLQLLDREVKQKYNNEVLKNENQRMQNELLQRKVSFLYLWLGIVFLFIVAFIAFWLYHRRSRRNINRLLFQLQINEKRLHEEEGTSEEERQRLLLENERLVERIKQQTERQKDKDQWNIYLQKQNILLSKQLKLYAKEYGSLAPEHAAAIHALLLLRNQPSSDVVSTDEEWQSVFSVIDMLYGDISCKLKGTKLSLQEYRICYLLHAGFTNRMIADISSVTCEAVAKAKQRMKNKFSLGTTDSFDDFVHKL